MSVLQQVVPRPVSTRGRGLPAGAAVLLAFAVTVLGGLLDALFGTGLGWLFKIGFVVGAVLAAWLVRKDGLRAAAVAPPLVYAVAVVVFGLGQDSSRTPTTHVMNLLTEIIFGAPALVLGTVAALVLVGVRIARR